MVRCFDGLKQLYTAVINFCNADLYQQQQARGLQHPEALSRETVCMLLTPYFLTFYDIWNFCSQQCKQAIHLASTSYIVFPN